MEVMMQDLSWVTPEDIMDFLSDEYKSHVQLGQNISAAAVLRVAKRFNLSVEDLEDHEIQPLE
jgi:hypothetical protein